jgi:hypothetical protein
MRASDSSSTTLFKCSVLDWRANYLAEKALRQQLSSEEKTTETEEAAPRKVIKVRRIAGRR